MTTSTLPILSESQPAEHPAQTLRPNPFLHLGPDRVYDPLTDRTMMQEEPGFASLMAMIHTGSGLDRISGVVRGSEATLGQVQGWYASRGFPTPGATIVLRRYTVSASAQAGAGIAYTDYAITPADVGGTTENFMTWPVVPGSEAGKSLSGIPPPNGLSGASLIR